MKDSEVFELALRRVLGRDVLDDIWARNAGGHADSLTDDPGPPDVGDRYLVDLAVTSRADCLVTGDVALLRHTVPGLQIASPRALLSALDAISD